MENQEQQLEMDSITTRATDIALSEPLEKRVNARFDLMQNNTNPAAPLSMNRSWTIENLIEQAHYIGNFSLNSTAGDTVWSYQNTIQNFISTFTNIAVNLFELASFDITFLFDFQSSPQVAGQFAITYDNMPQVVSNMRYEYKGVFYHMKLPRCLVTMGHNAKKSYTLRWNSALGKLNQYYVRNSYSSVSPSPEPYDMGTLSLVCINTVQAIPTVNTPTVRIWAQVQNLQYSGYNPSGKYLST